MEIPCIFLRLSISISFQMSCASIVLLWSTYTGTCRPVAPECICTNCNLIFGVNFCLNHYFNIESHNIGIASVQGYFSYTITLFSERRSRSPPKKHNNGLVYYHTSLGLIATLRVPFLWSVCLIKRNLTSKSLGAWRGPVDLTLHICVNFNIHTGVDK